jgi:hypothetical protein
MTAFAVVAPIAATVLVYLFTRQTATVLRCLGLSEHNSFVLAIGLMLVLAALYVQWR